MKLTDQQKRYIKLNGNAVYTTPTQAILHDPVLQVAGLTALFNIASNPYLTPEITILHLGSSALGMTGSMLLCKSAHFMELFSKFSSNQKNLCIDKAPDKNTPPTSPNHQRNSQDIRQLNLLGAASMSLKAIIFLGLPFALRNEPSFFNTSQIVLTFSALTSFITCSAAHFGAVAYRFNKVSKGDWVITDLPKKVEQKEEAKVTGIVPQFG